MIGFVDRESGLEHRAESVFYRDAVFFSAAEPVRTTFGWVALGFLLFFALEQFLHGTTAIGPSPSARSRSPT